MKDFILTSFANPLPVVFTIDFKAFITARKKCPRRVNFDLNSNKYDLGRFSLIKI
jgi:hypothetical protein